MKKRVVTMTFAWMLAALLVTGCGNTETPAEEVAAEIEEAEETVEETEAEAEETVEETEAEAEETAEETEAEAEETVEEPEAEPEETVEKPEEEPEEELMPEGEEALVGDSTLSVNAQTKNNDFVKVEKGDVISDYDMITLVNEDRANYGSAPLTWSEYLEKYCRERAVAIMANIHSKEYADAVARADGSAGMIAHGGAYETENLTYFPTVQYANSFMANENWINSPSHHAGRISTEYTQYACALYYDAASGDAVWVEAFGD